MIDIEVIGMVVKYNIKLRTFYPTHYVYKCCHTLYLPDILLRDVSNGVNSGYEMLT
jgi:hypothetical protein